MWGKKNKGHAQTTELPAVCLPASPQGQSGFSASWHILRHRILKMQFHIFKSMSRSTALNHPPHHSPNELHCLRVHGVRRLGLQRSFLHCFPTFHEGQSSIYVIHSLPQLVHLGENRHSTNSNGNTNAKHQVKRNALIWFGRYRQSD